MNPSRSVRQIKSRLLHQSPFLLTRLVHLLAAIWHNLSPPLTPRKEFFYFSDDGDLTALRYDNWKFVFAEQRAPGTLQVWAEPYTHLRVPLIFNLRLDPYERANITSNTYYDWLLDHAFMLVPAQSYVAKFLATFKDYPPRQKAASFTINQALEKLQQPSGD